MDEYFVSMAVVGFAAMSMAWVPTLTKKLNISYSIVYLLFGAIVYYFIDELPWPNPFVKDTETLHLTELVVIVALMGTGLKIDRPCSLKKWRAPIRMMSIAMLLCIAGITAIAYFVLGWDLASACLLGAVLAPTDPVLAGDVQVQGPNEGAQDYVRFTLTGEAGMNDGMAFPFTWLAIALAATAGGEAGWFVQWFSYDLLFRVAMGIIVGLLGGRLVVWLFFRLPEKFNVLHVRDGLVAISCTLLVYGLSELVHGYGFIAVFVSALTIRNYEMDHEYHEKLHAFTDQIERILLAILLVLFGGSLVGGILGDLTWPMALSGLVFLLIIRPVSGYLALSGLSMPSRYKAAIGFYGIKGIGSFFYLAFALEKADFAQAGAVWSLTAFVVLVSIVIHGFTAPSVLKRIVPSDSKASET
ncbi:MAG: sodium:proton antiporter [Cyclobacteriaceae bacterium]